MSETEAPDPKRIGDYEIEGLLGAGGMAKVYRAKHAILETVHAIKVLDPEYRANADARQRFLDEAKIQAKHLDHPNIVKVTNIVATADHAALVMELIDGTSLEAQLGALKSQPAEIKRIMLAVLDGVGHAHKAGIIHRDLKPANVLLAKQGNVLVPKVTDFGIAKVTAPDDGKGGVKKSTHAASRMGTLSYMSPEQVRRAKDVTPRSDIFSLGAMLYEMATGDMAFGGESEYDVMENIVNGRYQPAERRFDKIEPLLADVIQKALQTDPADRFESCEEMAKALRGEIKIVRKASAAPAATATVVAAATAPARDVQPARTEPARTDAPTSNKKTLAIVLVLAALALGGVAVFLAVKGGNDTPQPHAGSNQVIATATADAAEAAVDAPDDPMPAVDAAAAAVEPPPTPIDASVPPPPVDASVPVDAAVAARPRVDAGVVAVRPRVDAGVTKRPDAAVAAVPTTPQNPCAGTWRSKELTITITGTATSCGGSYTLTEVGAFSRGTCKGTFGGCRIGNLQTSASFSCKYSQQVAAHDNRGDGETGTFSMMCGGGNSAVVTIDRLVGDSKSISVSR